jgi:hypothetical protein
MKLDESSVPYPLHAAPADGSKPDEDLPFGGGADQSQDDIVEIPFPAPSVIDRLERGYVVDIFGDERGGQTPKRPTRRKGEQDE